VVRIDGGGWRGWLGKGGRRGHGGLGLGARTSHIRHQRIKLGFDLGGGAGGSYGRFISHGWTRLNGEAADRLVEQKATTQSLAVSHS
jgi:hypothetical protein